MCFINITPCVILYFPVLENLQGKFHMQYDPIIRIVQYISYVGFNYYLLLYRYVDP